MIINKGKIVANDTRDDIHNVGHENSASLLIEFSAFINEKELAKITGINKIRKIEDKKYILEFSQTNDIRQDVFNFAVKNNIIVLSMQIKERSLEEVFADLTTIEK
jgi:ABC-2 type transport system ATP-binding protein